MLPCCPVSSCCTCHGQPPLQALLWCNTAPCSATRQRIVQFLQWALAQPDTWALTYRQYVEWRRAPPGTQVGAAGSLTKHGWHGCAQAFQQLQHCSNAITDNPYYCASACSCATFSRAMRAIAASQRERRAAHWLQCWPVRSGNLTCNSNTQNMVQVSCCLNVHPPAMRLARQCWHQQ